MKSLRDCIDRFHFTNENHFHCFLKSLQSLKFRPLSLFFSILSLAYLGERQNKWFHFINTFIIKSALNIIGLSCFLR